MAWHGMGRQGKARVEVEPDSPQTQQHQVASCALRSLLSVGFSTHRMGTKCTPAPHMQDISSAQRSCVPSFTHGLMCCVQYVATEDMHLQGILDLCKPNQLSKRPESTQPKSSRGVQRSSPSAGNMAIHHTHWRYSTHSLTRNDPQGCRLNCGNCLQIAVHAEPKQENHLFWQYEW